MTFFVEHIGPYSYEKLANVEAAGLNGGTEHASAIFYGEKGVTAGRAPVVHEIAHQWFGNAVTERDWDDVWLSEGFATYFTLLYTEHAEGRDAFVAGLERSRETVLRVQQRLPDTPVIHRNLSDMRQVLNQLVYEEAAGCCTCCARKWAPRRSGRRFASTTGATRTRTPPPGSCARCSSRCRASGSSGSSRSGSPGRAFPKLEGSWRYDAAAKQVEVTISQSQVAEPFRLNVEVGIVAAPGAPPRVERLEMNGRQATMRFAADSPPASVVLDPGTWLLFEAGPFTQAR